MLLQYGEYIIAYVLSIIDQVENELYFSAISTYIVFIVMQKLM